MRVLIAVSNAPAGAIWANHLSRNGAEVVMAADRDEAISDISLRELDIIIVDVAFETRNAFAIADFAGYRQPQAKVIFVTTSTFFSDGSLFQLSPNACAIVPGEVKAEDLEAVAEYHATH